MAVRGPPTGAMGGVAARDGAWRVRTLLAVGWESSSAVEQPEA
jgi:hypothetical protein